MAEELKAVIFKRLPRPAFGIAESMWFELVILVGHFSNFLNLAGVGLKLYELTGFVPKMRVL